VQLGYIFYVRTVRSTTEHNFVSRNSRFYLRPCPKAISLRERALGDSLGGMNWLFTRFRVERRKTRERKAKETEEESETIVEPSADRVATESSRRPSVSASSRRILGRIAGGRSDIFIRAFARAWNRRFLVKCLRNVPPCLDYYYAHERTGR